jgi:DHA2 family multidrug resistance protein
MALLFIPVTTLSLSTLKGREIGEGAAFTGMMRQLGGSFGIAMITTFMAQQMIVHRADLVSKLDVTNYAVQSRVTGMQQAMIAKGSPPNIALQQAYQLIDYGVMKQASVLSYMDVFFYIGLMFLICVPFVLMVKGNRGQKVDMSAAH